MVLVPTILRLTALILSLRHRRRLRRDHLTRFHCCHWDVAHLDSLILVIAWRWLLVNSALCVYLLDGFLLLGADIADCSDHEIRVWLASSSKAENRGNMSRTRVRDEIFVVIDCKELLLGTFTAVWAL